MFFKDNSKIICVASQENQETKREMCDSNFFLFNQK